MKSSKYRMGVKEFEEYLEKYMEVAKRARDLKMLDIVNPHVIDSLLENLEKINEISEVIGDSRPYLGNFRVFVKYALDSGKLDKEISNLYALARMYKESGKEAVRRVLLSELDRAMKLVNPNFYY